MARTVGAVVGDGRYTGGDTVSRRVGERAPVGSAGAIISAVGRVRNAIVTSLNVVPWRPSLIVLVASYIMHAPPPDAALEQLLIIANADDYLIFEGRTEGRTDSSGLRIVLRRRRPRPWLIEIRRQPWREQATSDYTVWSVDWEQTSNKDVLRLELWQCSEQV